MAGVFRRTNKKDVKIDPGYIYIFYNKLYKYHFDDPHFYKVGVSKNLMKRYKTLNTGFYESGNFVYISKLFPDKYSAESKLFTNLNQYKPNTTREFLRCNLNIIITEIEKIEKEYGLNDSHNPPEWIRPVKREKKEKESKREKTIKIVDKRVKYKRPGKETNFPVYLKNKNGEEVVVYYATNNSKIERFKKSEKYKRALKIGWVFED
jgi:HD superfamily phosphohydrolase